jgi:protein KRI1
LNTKSLKRKRSGEKDETSTGSNGDSTSESEDEDDAGELATEALDFEILATLNAIRSKDPRVYDKETTFYTQIENGSSQQGKQTSTEKERPMFLRDYHRETLLSRVREDEKGSEMAPLSYNQEQEALKRSIVGEIHAATAAGPPSSMSEDDMGHNREDDEFLVAKPRKADKIEQPPVDVENADKDPEKFLSNFMTARAWVSSEHSQFQPFESDDEEEDRKAEEFEEAYNFRFEDPAKSNEKLISHARDIAAKYSVRREEQKPRKKQREAERERKEAAKSERSLDKARLRKLKIEVAEEKLGKIKKAAGIKGVDGLSPEDWEKLLDDDWNDAKWEEEMQKRFGEAYYAQDDLSNGEDTTRSTRKGRKLKKPKWDDDIEISDLIPDFDEGHATFDVSDEGSEGGELPKTANGTHESTKAHKLRLEDNKKHARKERRLIEQIVDDSLELDTALADKQKNTAGFRYRETSPLSFGLSARDILMAEDSQLNEYAGLKKLASFRDPSKKRKDQKHLGKKARLRQWRKETFGNESGPKPDGNTAAAGEGERADLNAASDVDDGINNVRTDRTKKKRRRSKKNKGGQEVSV